VTDIVDVAAEQRWTAWKAEGARLDARRASRMRNVFMTAGIAAIVWLLWSL
jgi:hypothetical protein